MSGKSRIPADAFYVDSTITISTKHHTRSLRLPLLIFLAIAGCLCTLEVCVSMVSPSFHGMPFWGISVLTIILVCILSILPKHLHLLGYLPLFAGIAAAFHSRELLVRGAKLFYNDYYSIAHHTETQFFEMPLYVDEQEAVTWLMCCCSVILCSIIARLLMRRPKFLFYFIMTFTPIEFGLYQGLAMNLPAILMVIVTWFGVLALQLAERRASQNNLRSVRYSASAGCGIAAIVLTGAAALAAVLIADRFQLTTSPEIQEKRQTLRHDIENMRWEDITGSLAELSIGLGIMEDPDVRELGEKSSLQYRNEDEVRLTFSELPDSGMYLKNYTGSVYEENALVILPEEILEDNENLLTLFDQFECMPQILPFMGSQSLYGKNSTATLEIEPLISTKLYLQPYASYNSKAIYLDDTGFVPVEADSYSFEFSKQQTYQSVFQTPLHEFYIPVSGFNLGDTVTADFFDRIDADTTQDMLCVTARQTPYIENPDFITQALQAVLAEHYVYRDFVYQTYTDVPESEALAEVYASLPDWLLQTAREGNDWATMQAVRQYLAEQSEYTLSPGKTPATRDFVNYFLLENHKGYCMHYATAGTVIARYLGIPARYCEGYVLSQDSMADGKENEDGFVIVDVPDSAGHAWCEIYLDGYGWVPFELTPGYYGEEMLSPGESSTTAATTTTAVPDVPAAESSTQTKTSVYTTAVTTDGNGNAAVLTATVSSIGSSSGQGGSLGSVLSGFLRILAILFLLILIAAMFVLLRRYRMNRRKRSFQNPDTIAAVLSLYRYLIRLLEVVSLSPGNQQLLEFAERAKQELNDAGYDGEGASHIIQLALAADMGEKAPTKEQLHEAVRYAERLALRIARNQKPAARFVMRYIHHLI
ncbi:MAG: transglutaminase domain-containing protein [Ruminococcus sp.]|nr:transglutaminase domain-containing protein [Ruminococcus sp.]